MNRRYIEFHYMAGRLLKGCLPITVPGGDNGTRSAADEGARPCEDVDDAEIRAAFIRALAEECDLPDKP